MEGKVSLAHGEGGELANKLIQDIFVRAFSHHEYARLDAAILNVPSTRLAVSTDSFVIKPRFFPGGNIGKLAVAGTVNDLAVSGATPICMTAAFIIEEGFLIKDLIVIADAMAKEALCANVNIVAGDTKVVERGNTDGIYINTTGIGVVNQTELPKAFNRGDTIISSGTIGDHGVAIIGARGELGIETSVKSDCASLNRVIEKLFPVMNSIKIMRDPTRGGVATTLVEICEDFGVKMDIEETLLPIKDEVRGVCDLLGLDPLYLANEGKFILIVAKESVEGVLHVLRKDVITANAKVIGKVTSVEVDEGKLYLVTPLGSKRILNRLAGVHIPRIC